MLKAVVLFSVTLLSIATVPATGQEGESPSPMSGAGVISANDVYVRSGDSLNHYTICKLQAGDKVTVVSQRGEWIEILPPEGTFSLVSGDFVDTTDNQTGVINGDNVRVRAGSLLNENKYTVQSLLTKGTPVTILGRNPDGFVRIRPPEGATVWINRNFVNVGGASTSASDPGAGTPLPASDMPTGSAGVPAVVTASAEKSAERLAVPIPAGVTTPLREQLEEIDAAARAELAKPALERRFEPVVSRYQPIAGQNDDTFAREYAKARIEQTNHLAALTTAIDRVRDLDQRAQVQRRESLAARSLIPEPQPQTTPTGIEVQGELRVSALYPPESPTPRYRLVDPSDATGRTIGYVELPSDAGIDVAPFLGKFVGIRAEAQRVQAGGVNPIPIYIAREFVLMGPPPAATAP